ncbi:MAG: Do family serine endopeptidase [Gammaproteobacteria bacterium]|nr:Do family serine endopeptidase [Gammaproteobacteria bacterium]
MRYLVVSLVFAAALSGIFPGGVSAAYGALPLRLPTGEELPSLAPMLDDATPTVVNIATYTTVRVRNPLLEDPFFRRFFNVPDQRRYRSTQSAGSGVVVDAGNGYIVTNNHVVERADKINVTLSDGRLLTATLVGTDAQVDLAVLKVDPESLQEISFANSNDLRVGDFVVAIGNPFGLSQTVTSGIISALGRSGLGIEGYEDFIQTDASINPGNSGGALVDLKGRLVGINTAILAPSGGNVGIGFAIPANMVRAIMDELIEHGEVRRGYLGLAVQGLNADLAEAFGVNRREGVVVVEVEPDSIAHAAGLRSGDIITRIGEREIARVSDFHSHAAVIFVGDEVDLEVLRDGRSRQIVLEINDDNLEKVLGRRIDARLAGTELQNFRNEDEPSMGAGVLVTDVDSQSAAYRFGLRAGDVLVAANRRDVRSLTELRESVRLNTRQLLLRVYRAGEFGFVAIR